MSKKYYWGKSVRLVTILFIFVCCTATYAQQTGSFTYQGKLFNLPPGAKFYPQKFKFIDYSESFAKEGVQSLEKDFMKDFSEEDMHNFKTIYKDDYAYYQEALVYFNKLSDRVNRTFTEKELWYIYIFDQELKNKLLYF